MGSAEAWEADNWSSAGPEMFVQAAWELDVRLQQSVTYLPSGPSSATLLTNSVRAGVPRTLADQLARVPENDLVECCRAV